jgi:hypothetical protein
MATTQVDVITDLASHRWNFDLVPTKWGSYSGPPALKWTSRRLVKASTSKVPTSSGIYRLVLVPSVKACNATYLMYVGKATNLRSRFTAYLAAERKRRPKLIRLLNLYPDHVTFQFCSVSKARLDRVEDALLQTFMPPCNDRIEGELGRARKAFP